MEDWFSLIPPIVTVLTAVITKRIIPSLILGLLVGSTLLVPNPLGGTIKAAEYIVGSLASKGGFTSYFIGSSWATWALIMPLGLPLAVSTGASLPLTMGAVLAGGSIGDNVSPLGETPVLTSAITDVPILEHVQTTLPYALIVIVISTALFVIMQTVLR